MIAKGGSVERKHETEEAIERAQDNTSRVTLPTSYATKSAGGRGGDERGEHR
jgi:hypothetical protein